MTLEPMFPIALIALVSVAAVALGVIVMMRSQGGARRDWALRIAMILLMALIALRPGIGSAGGSGAAASAGLEVYFVVDTTSSMAAEDWTDDDGQPLLDTDGTPMTRLDAARDDIAAISDSLVGAQFSLVTFDSVPVQRVPLTSDATALVSAAEVMTQEVTFYSRGSSIDAPLAFMTEVLTEAQDAHPNRQRVIFYLGDGEQTKDGAPSSFAPLAGLTGGGAVLGYGTEDGGLMRAFDGFSRDDIPGSPAYILDPSTGLPAESVIDEDNLAAVASQLGVRYLQRTPDEGIDRAVAGIDVGSVTVRPGGGGGRVEFYWLFALPIAAIALREVVLIGASLLEARRRGGGGL